jgi:hypothetical protein
MERLTFVTEDGEVLFHPEDLPDDEGVTITQLAVARRFRALETIAERLANREQAEEQGLLLRLPCKVGDTVYVVTSPFNVFDDIEYDENMKDEVYEAYVSSVSFYESGEQYRIYAKVTNHFIGAYFRECDFGKTVFLTKEEAEAKLAEMEGAE